MNSVVGDVIVRLSADRRYYFWEAEKTQTNTWIDASLWICKKTKKKKDEVIA